MARYHFSIRWLVAFAAVLCALLATRAALAATYTFQQDSDEAGVWPIGAMWDGGGVAFPNAIGDVAVFNQPVTTSGVPSGAYKLSLNNQAITVGNLTVNNSNFNSWTFQIGNDDLLDGSLTFENTAGNAAELHEESGLANVNTSRTRIFSPVNVISNLDIYQNHNLGFNTATEFVGKVNGAAGVTITKKGAGNLQMAYNGELAPAEGFFGNIVIEQGGIRIIGASTISKAAGVLVQSGGQLQIGNAVTSLSLGDANAVLTLNGAGKVAPSATNNEGALRYQLSAGIDSLFSSKIDLASDSRIRVNVSGTSASFTNVVSGPGKLTADGGGILILSGANTYAGGTALFGRWSLDRQQYDWVRYRRWRSDA